MSSQPDALARDDDGLTEARAALARRIARWTDGISQPPMVIPGLCIYSFAAPTEPVSYMHEPGICLIAQGAKRVHLCEEEYVYDIRHYLITSVGLPVVSRIIEASPQAPYLGLKLTLDMAAIERLMVDSDLPPPPSGQSGRGMAVGRLTPTLAWAFTRLLDLLDEPRDIPILAPLLQREIFYRLLVGDQGARLRQIATEGSRGHRVTRAIDWLKTNYAKPLRVEELAGYAGMSASTFHHHFRAVTAMSPLQFQKWVRLHEARRLMLTTRLDATSAAFQVGYESPSQFSREYSRLFGAPPLRDIRRLHHAGQPAEASAGS